MANSAPLQPLAIDEVTFKRLAELVRDETGIVLGDNKRNLVVSRLARRLRDLDMTDFSSYTRFISARENHEERRFLTSLLTTNVTRFFREDHHFQALAKDVLPPLVERARHGGRVRLWSAGCSTGEEPYSIAMQVLEAFPDAARHDFRILATDIDAKVIQTAQTGTYPNLAEGHVPDVFLKKYFQRSNDVETAWHVTEKLRELVTFGELNLLRDWPMRGLFDVIFCRNVVIYFDTETQARLWSRFGAILAPDGHLFIGHSERVHSVDDAHFEPTGTTQYRRVDALPKVAKRSPI
nr:protein-glutamate O-methyltransferase [Roseovarius sp. W115]